MLTNMKAKKTFEPFQGLKNSSQGGRGWVGAVVLVVLVDVVVVLVVLVVVAVAVAVTMAVAVVVVVVMVDDVVAVVVVDCFIKLLIHFEHWHVVATE